MPAFITHYLYGIDVYHNILPSTIKSLISKNNGSYSLGLQGPDIFYYHIPSSLHPSPYNIGNQMHETRISTFFRNYLKLLSTYHSEEFDIALSYLCGVLCHYTLDSKVHPYIYYRSGYDPTRQDCGQYSFPMHCILESTIDKILLQEMRKMQPSQFYPSKTVHLKPTEVTIVTRILSDCINQTYVRNPSSKDNQPLTSPGRIRNIIRAMKLESLLLHDSTGNRRQRVEHLSHYVPTASILSALMVTDDLEDGFDSCNRTHTEWINPWNKELASKDSFFNLYEKALQHYREITSSLSMYVSSLRSRVTYGQKPSTDKTSINDVPDLLNKIQNLSYHSGLDME